MKNRVSHMFNKSFNIIKISIIDSITYRVSVLVSMLLQFFFLLASYFFWSGIYGSENKITSYTFVSMLSYLVVANIIYNFSRPEGVMISNEIREGELNKYLLRPYGFIFFQFYKLLGNRIVFLVVNSLPIVVGGMFLIFFHLIQFDISFFKFSLFFVAVLLALILQFLIEILLGLLSFWFERSDFLYIVKEICFLLLAGIWIPLDLLPHYLSGVVKFTPFSYLAYFPAKILTSEEPISILQFTFPIIWMIGLALIIKYVWIKGLSRYEAYGW